MEDSKSGLLASARLICMNQISNADHARWFEEKLQTIDPSSFFLTFGLIGRRIDRNPIQVDPTLFSPSNVWRLDELCRFCLLLSLSPDQNVGPISQLLTSSDIREQVVIYKSLNYLPNADQFVALAIDGIRTNMTDVFDAIALDNSYPKKHFPEDAWNQMVLKAIFMERPIHRIIGLDERKNQKLAAILHDFVHERWSANRAVTPELWRLMPGFLNAEIFDDLRTEIGSGTALAKSAAIKALNESDYAPAKSYLTDANLSVTTLSWDQIGQEI